MKYRIYDRVHVVCDVDDTEPGLKMTCVKLGTIVDILSKKYGVTIDGSPNVVQYVLPDKLTPADKEEPAENKFF